MAEQQLSLWGTEFSIPDTTKKVLDKIENPKDIKKTISSKKVDIGDKLLMIQAEVNRILGKYKEDTIIIKTKDELVQYIDRAIENKIIAIDTETNNSLDPITCKLMGPCLYTPGMKNAYIPINHINRETNERLNWQLTEQDLFEQFSRLGSVDNKKDIEIITHNGKFDYEVLLCTIGWKMPVTWDTMLGARLLNENERAGLKEQYRTKLDPTQEKYDIEHLFEKLEYAIVDPDLFALYAATDSFITYKLYEYQKKQFEDPDLKRIYDIFLNVEMPVMFVSAQMELDGICIDTDYIDRLHIKYHKQLDELQGRIDIALKELEPQISDWRLTDDATHRPPKKSGDGFGKSKTEQLKNPPELTSPTQLAILLYDVLKNDAVDKKAPRSTGEEALQKLKDKNPICNLILEQRGLNKLIDAFIDSLPKQASPKDGRIHSHFNQMGTDTGRFSCTAPNLQQIPSKNHEIRMMFCAQPGYTLVGSDFSQQEPRCLTAFSKDPKFMDAYQNGKDMYATLGAGVYKCDYWDCMEHYQDGTKNEEGAKRRKKMKTVLLALTYGMGANTLAQRLNCPKEEAQKILEDFKTGFPVAQKWMSESEENAAKTGYVEDFWGRRRRLPDIQLPEYEVKWSKKDNSENTKVRFNPILGTEGRYLDENAPEILKYKKLVNDAIAENKTYIIKSLITPADDEGIYIKDNTGFISQAKRQCVNARIQGSAATMTKKAMINIHNDEEMHKLGFKLLIGVHDELIGECPIENADAVAERLTYLMKTCAPELGVPFKCDAEVETSWYKNEYMAGIKSEYNKLIKGNPEKNVAPINEDEAFKLVCEGHTESLPAFIREAIESDV